MLKQVQNDMIVDIQLFNNNLPNPLVAKNKQNLDWFEESIIPSPQSLFHRQPSP